MQIYTATVPLPLSPFVPWEFFEHPICKMSLLFSPGYFPFFLYFTRVLFAGLGNSFFLFFLPTHPSVALCFLAHWALGPWDLADGASGQGSKANYAPKAPPTGGARAAPWVRHGVRADVAVGEGRNVPFSARRGVRGGPCRQAPK